jgi:hypothetical protein
MSAGAAGVIRHLDVLAKAIDDDRPMVDAGSGSL